MTRTLVYHDILEKAHASNTSSDHSGCWGTSRLLHHDILEKAHNYHGRPLVVLSRVEEGMQTESGTAGEGARLA